MKFIIHMGGLWRLRLSQYERLRKAIASGAEIDLDDFGVMVSGVYRLDELEEEVRQEKVTGV